MRLAISSTRYQNRESELIPIMYFRFQSILRRENVVFFVFPEVKSISSSLPQIPFINHLSRFLLPTDPGILATISSSEQTF